MERPDGWVEQRAMMEIGLKAGGIPVKALEDWRNTYEAGADAMLKAVKDDMENLLAYAHGNDQCDDEDFKEMDKIAEQWNLSK